MRENMRLKPLKYALDMHLLGSAAATAGAGDAKQCGNMYNDLYLLYQEHLKLPNVSVN